MVIRLFGHPFSSYTWKALIAFYENDTPFGFRMTGPAHPENAAELARQAASRKRGPTATISRSVRRTGIETDRP